MKRRDIALPSIVLDRRSGESLCEQIARQIGAAIRDGALVAGARLPSTRWMARLLGVSRNTVVTAYEDLGSLGLIRGERGSGMRVASRASPQGMQAIGLRRVFRAARFPERIVTFADPDGNPLYLNF